MNSCKEFISNLALTIHYHFPPPLIILMLFSVTITFSLFFIQVYKTRKYIKNILKNITPLPFKIRRIAKELGIENKLVVTKSGNFTSFCFGLFYSRICLNLKFVSSLTKEELRAVLLHEVHHLKNKDPLKILIAQTLQSLLFFLPISKDFQNHYLLSQEIAADKEVLKQTRVFALRNALIKSIDLPEANFALAQFSEHNLEQRVKILTATSNQVTFKLSASRLIMSVFVVTFYFLSAQLPIYAMDNGSAHSYFFCTTNQRLFSPANYSPAK